MLSPARSAVAPLYLLACLLLGGGDQGIWGNMILQLIGLVIIAWAAAAPDERSLSRPARRLLMLAVAAVAIVALQAVPLPPEVWGGGSRSVIAEGFRVLGQPVPAAPVSLTPYESLAGLLCIIPPLAIFCAISRLNAYRPSWLAAALLCGAIAGIILGALQVVSSGSNSSWYLFRETNIGVDVGFFANPNHMADLLVIALPFLAATAAAAKGGNFQRHSARFSVLAGILILLLVGITLNGSSAGYTLAVPVLAASALIVLPAGSHWRGWLAGFAALSVVASLAGLANSSIGGTRIGQEAVGSVPSREQILATTGKAIADYMPLGSGLGSFVRVYRLYESPDAVTNKYVIHAHNDYVEIALELGLAGVFLLLLFLEWWISQSIAVWRRGEDGPWARAASIASGTVLVHSLVDFPLRSAAIAACFAMCLALLAERQTLGRQEKSELRPTRHIVIV